MSARERAREEARAADGGCCASCGVDLVAREREWLAKTRKIRELFAAAKPDPEGMSVSGFELAYAQWRQAEEAELRRVPMVRWSAVKIGRRVRMLCDPCKKRLLP